MGSKQKEDLRLDHLNQEFMVSITKLVILKFLYSSESPGRLLKAQVSGLTPGVYAWVSMMQGQNSAFLTSPLGC